MRGLSSATEDLIRYAYDRLEANHSQTLRQLHYAIFSRWEIDDAVSGLVNPGQWKPQAEIQEIELECIADFADRLKNLPQASVVVRA